jgi:hypothetical protein
MLLDFYCGGVACTQHGIKAGLISLVYCFYLVFIGQVAPDMEHTRDTRATQTGNV